MKVFKQSFSLDHLGITASTLCAIHCAALPFLLSILPIWGLGFLASPTVEVGMIAMSLLLGITSLSSAYRKGHKNILPICLLLTGFGLIAFGHFSGMEILEPFCISTGGFTIATAHFINLRMLKNCLVKHKHSHRI